MSAVNVTQRGGCIVCGAGAGMVLGGGNLCGLGARGRVNSSWGVIGLASGYEPPANGAQSLANAGTGAKVRRIAKQLGRALGLGTSGLRGGRGVAIRRAGGLYDGFQRTENFHIDQA
jgi:hypothetical protein